MNEKKLKITLLCIAGVVTVALIAALIISTKPHREDSAPGKEISDNELNSVMIAYEWGVNPVYYAEDHEMNIEADHSIIPSRFREVESAFSASIKDDFIPDEYKIYALNGKVVEALSANPHAFDMRFYTNVDPLAPVTLVCNGIEICKIPVTDCGLDSFYYRTNVVICDNNEYEFYVKCGDTVSNRVNVNISAGGTSVEGSETIPPITTPDTPESEAEADDRIQAPDWKPVKKTESKDEDKKENKVSEQDGKNDKDEDTKDVPVINEKDVENKTESYIKKYIDFMMANADGKNAVFSPESLNSALCMYDELTEEPKELVKLIKNIDYLGYESNDTFKTINRLWINKNKDINVANINLDKDCVYEIDMNKEGATKEKNDWVSEQTDGFITSTPTQFNNRVCLDAMNVVYFKDKWKDGDKTLSDIDYTFYNADKTEKGVKMIQDTQNGYLRTDNATAVSMMYYDGFRFTVVVPDEGTDIKDVVLSDFITEKAKRSGGKVNLYMPEFEIEKDYELGEKELGIKFGRIKPDIMKDASSKPAISQVAKIKVDHTGTEAAAVTEMIVYSYGASSKEKPMELICDRPFYFYITDALNNDIAFIGVVNKL